MKRRILIVDTAQQVFRLEALRVEMLNQDEREDYLTLHGEALCQYMLRRDGSDLTIARGPMAYLAGNKATIGYISPLTKLPHYSFVGGRAAAQLFYLGVDAIVLTGSKIEVAPIIVISGHAPDITVTFKSAQELPKGQRAAYYALVHNELGGIAETGSVFTLGEGAQHGYLIANLAVDGIYHAGRGGAGYVFITFARALVLRGEPVDRTRFFQTMGADVSFSRHPNGFITRHLIPHTARLSGKTGGTITKLFTTGCLKQPQQTLPARNATQMGYEFAGLGDTQILSDTRDGHTGCEWCPVDCRHWHWVDVDYAPDGKDRFLDDFEPTYALFAMLNLVPENPSFSSQKALLRDVNQRLIAPIEQMGCDIMDVGIGLAALFEGLERDIIPHTDVPPELTGARLGDLESAVVAVNLLRSHANLSQYPALEALGAGPQGLVERYPGMKDIVFTCGDRTLGNAGHSNALWTFMMPFSRFFSHYSGTIYKIDEKLPFSPDDVNLKPLFQRVVKHMFEREFFSILCNALSCCAFTFVIYSQDGLGEKLDDSELLVRVLAEYGLHTSRQDLLWFSQNFWAQSIDIKRIYGWRPPAAEDFPDRIYEALSLVLKQPVTELKRWMDMLIGEWKTQAASMLMRYGYDASWLDQTAGKETASDV